MTNGIIVGRFQPFHCNHFKIVEKALSICDKLYIAIGSANVSGTLKNPMNVFDREEYIKDYITVNICKPELLERIEFIYLDDFMHDHDFFHEIGFLCMHHKINYIFGHKKSDGSSDWVNSFYEYYKKSAYPSPEYIDVETGDDTNSTMLRQRVLDGHNVGNYDWSSYREYAKKIEEYNNQFFHPYCSISTHLTVDLIIEDVYRKKILLIKRNKGFGSGKYAMIGGFVEPNETLENAIIRECFEEIGFYISAFIKSCSYSTILVDNPFRSDRGRIITQVYKISLNSMGVNSIENNFKENDEVSELIWVDKELFNSVIKYNTFEDHSLIVNSFGWF